MNLNDPSLYEFPIVLRGYDRATVEAAIDSARSALTGTADVREQALDRIGTTRIPVVLRGYDRAPVDAVLAALAAALR